MVESSLDRPIHPQVHSSGALRGKCEVENEKKTLHRPRPVLPLRWGFHGCCELISPDCGGLENSVQGSPPSISDALRVD